MFLKRLFCDKKPETRDPDLSGILAAWGTDDVEFDLDKDGIVDGGDLGLFLLSPPVPEKEPNDLILYPQHGVLTTRYFPPGLRYELHHQLEKEEALDKSAKTRAGAENFYIWYASWDGSHGKATGSLSITEDLIVEDVKKYYGDKEPEGYGQLDYEGNFFRGLNKGKGTKEHEEATRVMLSAIRRMKKEFPKMKWTYYGLPMLKYWLPHPSPTNAHTWLNAPDDVKKAEIQFKFDCYDELLKECDWLNPSFYNRYDPDVHKKDIIEREAVYRKELIRFCHLINERQGICKPIIPMTCPWYQNGGKIEYIHKIVPDDIMVETVFKPFLEEGINGFAIWYAQHFWARQTFGRIRRPEHFEAFIRNYGLDRERFNPDSMTEEQSRDYLDYYMELSSKTILRHIKMMRHTMDSFYA